MNKAVIRNERESDYNEVERITREAFYNLYIPGCMEHYLVRVMRGHEDFVPELDLVLELDGQVIGNIMYTKAALTDETGTKKEILTFGPVSIAPEFQRKGYGTSLIEYSLQRAAEMGYDAVVIVGSPANYVHLGFQSCRRYDICVENGKYPAAMMVKELSDGALKGKKWVYRDSPVMSAIEPREAHRYDDTLTPMEKKKLPSQEEFYILSNSFIE